MEECAFWAGDRQRASAAVSMSWHARQPPARSRDDAVGRPPAPRAPEDGERTAPSHRPGRRVQNPNGAWACPGHVLGLLVHLALLPAASGWKLPSNALPNDARIGAATNGGSCGDGSCSRARRQLASGCNTGCNSGWCARPALAPGRLGLSAPPCALPALLRARSNTGSTCATTASCECDGWLIVGISCGCDDEACNANNAGCTSGCTSCPADQYSAKHVTRGPSRTTTTTSGYRVTTRHRTAANGVCVRAQVRDRMSATATAP